MHLKRFFISISVFLSMAILIGPSQGFSQSRYDEEGSGAGIIGTFAGGSYDALLPSDIGRLLFGEKPKNIYAFMYDQAKFKPERVAVQRIIAEQTALSEDDLTALRGRLSRLYGFIPEGAEPLGPEPTQQEIALRQAQLENLFDEERDIAAFQSEIESEVFMTEIFANGSRDDSGFDLLYDLDVMDAIIFGEEVPLYGSSGPGSPAGARRHDIGIGVEGEEESEEEAEEAGGERRGEAGRLRDREIPAIPGGSEAAQNQPPFSQALCSANSNVDQAVREFLQKEQSGEILGPLASSERASQRRQSSSFFGAGTGDEENLTPEQRRERIFTPDHPGDFRRARLCYGPFCLEIKERYKKESSYPVTLSCIACHIEKMNDAFSKTLSQNLIPGKVTGNVLEPSICKSINIGDLIDVNIVAIPSPIVTPPNDDIVVEADVWEAFKKFDEQYRPFLVDQLLQAIDAVESPEERNQNRNAQLRSVEQSAGHAALSDASDATTQADVTRNIRTMSNSARDNQLRLLRNSTARNQAEEIAQEFQALAAEMEQFNTYFRNLQKLFKDMQAPCNALLNKPYCS